MVLLFNLSFTKKWYGVLIKISLILEELVYWKKNITHVGIYFVWLDNLSFEAFIMYSLLCFGYPHCFVVLVSLFIFFALHFAKFFKIIIFIVHGFATILRVFWEHLYLLEVGSSTVYICILSL